MILQIPSLKKEFTEREKVLGTDYDFSYQFGSSHSLSSSYPIYAILTIHS